jgi:uncharacterized membrane protein
MQIRETLRRSFSSFLAVPSAVIGIFVVMSIGSYLLEQTDIGWLRTVRDFMQDHVFGDPGSTSDLLGTIAGGVITVTSITFSLLLIALQQSAGSLTHQVFDQFLRRRSNQVFFGFFVGMTLYALITLATVNPPYNPVLGATLALVLTIVSLYLLIILIYSTIDQMRPTEIINTIHEHTLRARERQLGIIGRTRRQPHLTGGQVVAVHARHDGFVGAIDLDVIEGATARASSPVEVVLLLPVGTYVSFQDEIAEVRAAGDDDAREVAEHVERAIQIVRERDLDNDPAFGIEQLATIAWRSISTSQQNPSPGIATIRNLRDLLARWSVSENEETDDERAPLVYPDNVMASLFDAFESLAVVASEAMQHQTYAEIVRSIAITFERLPLPHRQRAEDLLLRSLPALGDHVLTADLDDALNRIERTLDMSGRFATASAIRDAHEQLASTIGTLNSRSTRVPAGA